VGVLCASEDEALIKTVSPDPRRAVVEINLIGKREIRRGPLISVTSTMRSTKIYADLRTADKARTSP